MPAVNPQVGIQGGLLGYAPQTAAVQQPGSLMNYQPGYWSQQAYKMAGSPVQGPYAPVPVPAATGVSGSSGAGGSALGGTALGILGALAKNPSILKSGYNAISGLLGGAGDGSAASILAGGSPTLSAVGTGAVAPAVDSAAADAAGALGGADAGAGAAAGGLLGGAGSGAVGAAGANALAASGGFATGGAAGAAGGSSAAGAGTLGAAGAAIPLAAAAIPFLIGMNGDKANVAGNAAMSQWMKASGATFKPNYTNSGQNTFGTNNGLLNASSNPGTWYDSSGKAMSETQTLGALRSWAQQNGVSLGNLG